MSISVKVAVNINQHQSILSRKIYLLMSFFHNSHYAEKILSTPSIDKKPNQQKRNKPKLIPFLFESICRLNYSAAGVSSGAISAAGASTATGAAVATTSAFLAAVERRVRTAFLVAFSFNMFSL
jgi:hypothetical protein